MAENEVYMNLSRFTKATIDELRENLNLTDDELIVFNMLSKGKSQVQIADKMNVSVKTVATRTRRIKDKMIQLGFKWK